MRLLRLLRLSRLLAAAGVVGDGADQTSQVRPIVDGQRIAGLLAETTIAGAPFLRVDVLDSRVNLND